MNSRRKPNAMLIELVIVILFFAISAGIILQLFVAAHERSLHSSVDTAALLVAEDYAERFAASEASAEAFWQEAGFAPDGDAYARQVNVSGHSLTIRAAGASEATEAGTLDRFSLSILDGDRQAVALPVSRYLPKEGAP